MAPRVLSTEQAKTAIQQVQAIINGGLTEQISKLDAQGRILSTPDVWDGPLAQQFRDQTWPETKSALDRAHQELDQLRDQLQKIAQNIMTAGGGGRGRPPGCTPARTAPTTRVPTASARSTRARARATGACWASARSSSRWRMGSRSTGSAAAAGSSTAPGCPSAR